MARRQPLSAASRETFWRSLQTLNVTRIVIALVLLLYLNFDARRGHTMGSAYAETCMFYAVAALLFAFRNGDANMRSVWLCTRNDMIGNAAVLLAALGVWQAGSALPDLFVAGVMGFLGLSAAHSVIRQARAEMKTGAPSSVLTVELKR